MAKIALDSALNSSDHCQTSKPRVRGARARGWKFGQNANASLRARSVSEMQSSLAGLIIEPLRLRIVSC